MENLLEKSKKELLEMARDLKVKSYSKLSKPELIDAIEELTTSEKKQKKSKNIKEENIVKSNDILPEEPKSVAKDNVFVSEGYSENISYSIR